VRGFIEAAHQEAYDLLVANRDVLDALVLALLERETLDKEEIEEIFAELRLREPRPAWTGSARRRPDERGPVVTPAELTVSAAASTNGSINGSTNSHLPAALPAGSTDAAGADA